MMRRVVILGGDAGGTIVAQTIADLAATNVPIELLGFLNDTLPAGSQIRGIAVLGAFSGWRACPQDAVFISALPKAKEALQRYRRIVSLDIPVERWTTLRHPRASVAPGVPVGHGTCICANVVVEPGARIGAHAFLRAGSYVSHDVEIGNFAFVGPNATLLGRSRLGDGAYFAANSVCREETSIERYAVVGIGSVVLRAVDEFSIVAGNPARLLGTVPRDTAALAPS